MVTNDTSANAYPIEDGLRLCTKILKNYCTVFAVYDMCRSERKAYETLTMKREKMEKSATGRGTGE